MTELTPRQQQIVDFIADFQTREGCSPSFDEIGRRFRFRSPNAVAGHLRLLSRKGVIDWKPGKARSLRLANRTPTVGRTVVEIPLFGTIAAGFGDDGEQEADGCVPVAVDSLAFKPTRHTFALRVKGDSMIGKHICDGDVVILEHGPEPLPGQVVAALIDRKSTLKTYLIRNRKPFLKAENPKYPEFLPAEELVIQGVFRALIRQAKS